MHVHCESVASRCSACVAGYILLEEKTRKPALSSDGCISPVLD